MSNECLLKSVSEVGVAPVADYEPSAPRSLGQGADTIVWCATLPDGGPTGGFFHDRRPIPW